MTALKKFEISTVHQAIARAVDQERGRVALTNANFKMDPNRKVLAESICQKHGTTLSGFLRGCVDLLLLDYLGPKKSAEMGILPTE